MTPPATNRPRLRASVLMIVIVTLMFAAAALVAFIEKAGNDLLVETRAATLHRLRQQAYSTLEVTLAVLNEFQQVDGGLRSAAEGWGDPLGFAGWEPAEGCTAEVSFEDESGKLSLAHVDAGTLLGLFKLWGVEDIDAQRVTDSLMSWMQKDYVPATTETPDYENAALPYDAPLRPLRSYAELAAIDHARDVFYDKQGRPNELYRRFVAALSLYDFKQSNLNGAPGDVLGALGALTDSQRHQISDYLAGAGEWRRAGPAFFQSTEQAAGLVGAGTLPAGFGTAITALRIDITIRQGSTAFHLTTVVAPPNGATVVRTTAESTSITDPTKADNPAAPAADGASTAATTPAAGTDATTGGAAAQLKYPFTLLEIRENAEVSAVSPAPTATPE